MADMTEREKDFLKLLRDGSTGFKSQVKKLLGTSALGGGPTLQDTLTGGVMNTAQELERVFKAREEMLKSVGVASRGAADATRELENESRKLFGTTENGLAAVSALSAEMRTFAFMNSDVQKELGKTTMVLERFGVDMSTTGQILDSASMAFGMSNDELGELATGLAKVVSQFPGQAQEIARNFKQAQSSLAYDSGKIMDVFKKLQFTSSTTGVSFDSLTSAFGDAMDTFEGSASKAGSLNAILGRSVFNSIDLLGKTEAERVDTIVKGVRQSIGGDVNRLGKFQLKAVAEGMGLSVEDTRRLLSGQTTPEAVMKDKGDPRAKLQEQANKALDANTMSIEELISTYKTFRDPVTNANITLMNKINDELLKQARKRFPIEDLRSQSEAYERIRQIPLGLRGDSFKNFETRYKQGTGLLKEEDLVLQTTMRMADEINSRATAMMNSMNEAAAKVKDIFNSLTGNITTPVLNPQKQTGANVKTTNNQQTTQSSPIDFSGEPGYKALTKALSEVEWSIDITGFAGDTLKGMLKTIGITP